MSGDPENDDSSYSGRWVARIKGRIVGQGGTPEAARRSAALSRHKEKAEISYMHTIWPAHIADLVHKVGSILPEGQLYLVGGAIRDALLERTSHDFDFVVRESAVRCAKQVASGLGGDFYVLDEEFGAGRVILTGEDGKRDILDFTAFRGGSIQADLALRDFTINAMALSVKDGTSLDPLQGTADLRGKVIRACSTSAMEDDPVRILRAVRLAAALDFHIEAATREQLRAASSMLPAVSNERKRDELFRMLGGPRPGTCMRALELLGVFAHFLPELGSLKGVEQPSPHIHDAWDHTLSVMGHLGEMLDLLLESKVKESDGLQASILTLGIGRYRERMIEYFSESLNQDRSMRALLQFAALFHDAGKPATQSRGEDDRIRFIGHEKAGATLVVETAHEFNLSNAEVNWVEAVVLNHMRFFSLASRMEAENEAPTRRAIYRFFRDAGPVGVALILLGLADVRGAREHLLTEKAWSAWVAVARILLESLWERPEEAVTPMRLLDGNEVMQQLSLPPGPALGQLLEAIREAQAAGEVTDREGALAFAREWTVRNGSKPAL